MKGGRDGGESGAGLLTAPHRNLFSNVRALLSLGLLLFAHAWEIFFEPQCFSSLPPPTLPPPPVSTQMSYQHSREDAAYQKCFLEGGTYGIHGNYLSRLEWSVYSRSICILIVCERRECESSEGFGRKDMIAFMSHQAACWIQGNA